MTVLPKTALPEIYATIMREIKLRLDAIASAFYRAQKDPGAPAAPLDCEMCYLQLRRCSELIALAALVAHNGIAEFRRKTLMKEWKAADLIKMLADLSNDAFPEPTVIGELNENGDGDLFIESLAGKNRSILSAIYGGCSDKLHAGNLKRLLSSGGKNYDLNEIHEWRNFIVGLLNTHAILLPDRRSVMIVFMARVPHGDVSCELADLEQVTGSKGVSHPSPPPSLRNKSWSHSGIRRPKSS